MAIPPVPTGLTLTVSGTTVTMKWVNGAGTLGNDIYVDGTEVAWPGGGASPPTPPVTTYTVEGLANGTHTFAVSAYNSSGNSAPCVAVSATIGGAALPTAVISFNADGTVTGPTTLPGTATGTIKVASGQVTGLWSSGTPAAVPVVKSVTPASGVQAGGINVIIMGTGFTGATKVMFGNVAATAFNVINDGEISATVPAYAGALTADEATVEA